MHQPPPPIQDDILADNVIDQFLRGYDPLLFAADFGLSPETVMAQIRWTLQRYINNALAAESKLSRKGKAGRPRVFDSDAERYAFNNAKRKKKTKGEQ